MSKMMILLLALFVALGVLAAAPQSASTIAKGNAFQNAPKEDRVSGTIARSTPEKSILTLKEHNSNIERTVIYNASTQWTKDKKPVDMKLFKDGSRVVCVGKFDEKKVLTATRCELQP